MENPSNVRIRWILLILLVGGFVLLQVLVRTEDWAGALCPQDPTASGAEIRTEISMVRLGFPATFATYFSKGCGEDPTVGVLWNWWGVLADVLILSALCATIMLATGFFRQSGPFPDSSHSR